MNPNICCVQITPNDRIYQTNLKFDYNTQQNIEEQNNTLIAICARMKIYYGCGNYKPRIGKALYPDNSFYYAFYQDSMANEGKPFNPLATHIINCNYNTNNTNTGNNKLQCYGNCYIICLDPDFNPCDCGIDMFINNFNKVYTLNGTEEREYTNRIYKNQKKNKCYSYDGFVKHSKKQNRFKIF